MRSAATAVRTLAGRAVVLLLSAEDRHEDHSERAAPHKRNGCPAVVELPDESDEQQHGRSDYQKHKPNFQPSSRIDVPDLRPAARRIALARTTVQIAGPAAATRHSQTIDRVISGGQAVKPAREYPRPIRRRLVGVGAVEEARELSYGHVGVVVVNLEVSEQVKEDHAAVHRDRETANGGPQAKDVPVMRFQ